MDGKIRSVRRHALSANATAFAEMCLMLNKGKCTQNMIRERVGISPYTVVKWLRVLKRRHLIYVEEWIRSPVGQPAAAWSWGYKEIDAPRPPPMTQKDYYERAKIRKRLRKSALSASSGTSG